MDVRRILIFRALELDDMMGAIPAMRAIRQAFPLASISLLTLPHVEPHLRRFRHYVDEFISFPGFPGLSEWTAAPDEVAEFIALLKEREFDLAFQLHGQGEVSNQLLMLIGAKRLYGFYRGPHHQGSDYATLIPYTESECEKRYCLRPLGLLGMFQEVHVTVTPTPPERPIIPPEPTIPPRPDEETPRPSSPEIDTTRPDQNEVDFEPEREAPQPEVPQPL